jgi:hypothetical protein
VLQVPELRELDGVQLTQFATPSRRNCRMPLQYHHLDERTRRLMLEEIEADVSDGSLHTSPRLNRHGLECYSNLLRDAARLHNDQWLAWRLQIERCLKQTETRRTKNHGVTTVDVPFTAPEIIADGEFNAFYVRAICRRAMEDGFNMVQVYRGKSAMDPRPESQAKIGALIPAAVLLNDLRRSKGVDSSLGVPAGPNSGISVRLPARVAG